jgi:hypothetical protein
VIASAAFPMRRLSRRSEFRQVPKANVCMAQTKYGSSSVLLRGLDEGDTCVCLEHGFVRLPKLGLVHRNIVSLPRRESIWI